MIYSYVDEENDLYVDENGDQIYSKLSEEELIKLITKVRNNKEDLICFVYFLYKDMLLCSYSSVGSAPDSKIRWPNLKICPEPYLIDGTTSEPEKVHL